MAYAFALARRGSTRDIEWLTATVKQEKDSLEWGPRMNAIYSLGVLRHRGARELLQRIEREERGTFSGEAATYALKLLETPCEGQGKSTEETLKRLVLGCVGPRMRESPQFVEESKMRVWTRQGDEWETRPVTGETKKLPSIAFEHYLSPNMAVALVDMSVYFGPLNAQGYRFVFVKKGGKWILSGLTFTWVS